MEWNVIDGEIIPESREAHVVTRYLRGSDGHVIMMLRWTGGHWEGLAQFGAYYAPQYGVFASGYATYEASGRTTYEVEAALWRHYEEEEMA